MGHSTELRRQSSELTRTSTVQASKREPQREGPPKVHRGMLGDSLTEPAKSWDNEKPARQ